MPTPRPAHPAALLSLTILAVALGCEPRTPTKDRTASATASAERPARPREPSPTATAAPAAPARAASGAPAASAPTPLEPWPATELVRLFRDLSEPGEPFFSDNTISNETSYLQVAPELAARPDGGVYVGVGPEQNFTYIALTAPEVAFIVDIRRDNALLHLLYRALFERASTRAELVALLLGRPHVAAGDPEASGDVAAVLAHAVQQAPDPHHQATVQAAAWSFLTRDLGLPLTEPDRLRLAAIHRVFYDGQLELRFQLHEPNGRRYPSLRELLTARDAAGKAAGFLGSHAAFRRVRDLERANRVVPVVGDFAGTRALAGVAAELRARQLAVATFYVSNVEQYLLDPDHWPRWIRNVAGLPARGDAVFVRAYLDQGRAHPAQLAGHRTTTLVQPLARLLEGRRPVPGEQIGRAHV